MAIVAVWPSKLLQTLCFFGVLFLYYRLLKYRKSKKRRNISGAVDLIREPQMPILINAK